MFCNQCEQTTRSANGHGCVSTKGVCGKDSITADLQDLLVYAIEGIAQYAKRVRELGQPDSAADAFILYGFFTTLTNVNFSAARFVNLLHEAAQIRNRVRAAYQKLAHTQGLTPETLTGPAAWVPAMTPSGLASQASCAATNRDIDIVGADIVGLREMMIYGIKGLAAYAHHANVLGYTDEAIYTRLENALDFLANEPTDVDVLLAQCLEVGALNLKVMELLEAANTETFGQQQPTKVRISPIKGKAILVSGHDLYDLAQILEQTKDKGIHVYTHGELLSAHAYPGLKAYPHLVGNYGGAWHQQQHDFANFPGAILITSNCMIEPQAAYRQHLFTSGLVGWQGVCYINNGNFTPIIQAALALPGFHEDAPEKTLTIGFGQHAVLNIADQLIEAVQNGALQHFFLIGGCDGPAPSRHYYTDLAKMTPPDTVVMTLGCGKFRFHDYEFGQIGAIPRLLDIGQCNDAYSAIKIADALAKAFGCDINALPLSLMVSWFEQKAVAVLLSLLSLGIRGIHLGPTLPTFLTPNLLNILVEKFDIRPNGMPAADLADALR